MNWAQPTISGAIMWVREEGIGKQGLPPHVRCVRWRGIRARSKDARKAFVQRDLPGTENYHHVFSRGTRQLGCAQLLHWVIWLRIHCRNWQFAALNFGHTLE